MKKEWLWLTFLPQEDSAKLNILRSNLTPFLEAVTIALSMELEEGRDLKDERKEDIFDEIIEIIENLPHQNSNFSSISNQTLNTLEFELDQLKGMNIQ